MKRRGRDCECLHRVGKEARGFRKSTPERKGAEMGKKKGCKKGCSTGRSQTKGGNTERIIGPAALAFQGGKEGETGDIVEKTRCIVDQGVWRGGLGGGAKTEANVLRVKGTKGDVNRPRYGLSPRSPVRRE